MWSWWREMEYQKYLLRDIGDIVSGATPKTAIAENFGGDIPWLTPADLSGYTQKYISCGARNLTKQGYDSCSTQIMPTGTVLFSNRVRRNCKKSDLHKSGIQKHRSKIVYQ